MICFFKHFFIFLILLLIFLIVLIFWSGRRDIFPFCFDFQDVFSIFFDFFFGLGEGERDISFLILFFFQCFLFF